MDFDYNTVKYLVIILSLLILGYVIFLIYTDLTTVRGECNKLKTKLFETSDSLTELQKQIEYVSAETETEIDEQENTLHEILNNNFFTPTDLDEEDDLNDPEVPAFSFNIPLFDDQNKITELKEESPEQPENNEEEIQFISTSNQCEGIVATGKNKGKQCSKDSIVNEKFCTKHSK